MGRICVPYLYEKDVTALEIPLCRRSSSKNWTTSTDDGIISYNAGKWVKRQIDRWTLQGP